MKKIFVFLMLGFLLFACTITAPVPPPLNTLSYTPTPPSTPVGSGDTPGPTYTPPAARSIPHPPLATSGPYLAYLRSQGDQYEIVLTDADGKGQKTIPYPANANTQVGLPSLSDTLSPDGQWLAYYTGSAGSCFGNGGADTADLTLNLMSLSDGKTQVITKLLSQDYPNNFAKAAQELNRTDVSAEMLQNAFVCGIMQSVAWSPDGRSLAFAGQMDGLSSDLYLYDTVAGTIKRLSSGPQEVGWISWSPNGKWILDGSSYSTGEGTKYSVYATSVDGASVKLLPNFGPIGWLNDQMYFSSKGDNGPGSYDLTLFNIVTGKTAEIWNGSFGPFAFIPGGNWVAVYANTPVWPYSYNSDFQTGIFLINTTTLNQTRVNSLGPWGCCLGAMITAFDSAENRMFLIKNNTDQGLQYLSSDGTLAPVGVDASTFSVAPNKQYILTIGNKISVLKPDGTSVRDVDLPANLKSENIGSIIWRPDSSGLFFNYLDPKSLNPSGQLYAMDLLTGDPVQVDMDLSIQWVYNFEWVAQLK